MRPDGDEAKERGPASPLERYLTYWFVLVMALGGAVGFFASDLSESAEVPSAHVQLVHE